MRILVLGLGNDLIADDAVGILAVRRLREELQPARALGEAHGCIADEGDSAAGRLILSADVELDIIESSVSGVALLEHFVDHDAAIVVDAVATGRNAPGTILDIDPAQLGPVVAPSAHYAGLPEIMALASRLELHFPAEVKILAVEVVDHHTIGGPISAPVEAALPELVRRVRAQIDAWAGAAP